MHFHYSKTRTLFSRTLALTLFLCALFLALTFQVHAETTEELQSKIESSADEIERLNKEIASYQSQLTTISKQSNTLANEVKELDLTKKKLEANLRLTETKIKSAEKDIVTLGGEIVNKEVTIDERSKLVAQSIREIHESSEQTLLEMLLSHTSFSDAWARIDNIQSFKDALRTDAQELVVAKGVLVDTRNDVTKKREELLGLRTALADQKKILDASVKEKNTLLSETKNQESLYAKMVADKKALVAAFEAEMRRYEEQLTYVAHPDTLPAAGSAPLSWPLASVVITQQFGKTVDSARLYASGTHSGVDFRASVGTPVYAMSSGTIGGAGDTDASCRGASFGKWVLIRYDNGLASTYGHMSLIKVKNGDKVSRGDIVGYSGNTGHSTAPHLHVSMYPSDAVSVEGKESLACRGKILTQPRAATTAYLDPLQYMPKTTIGMFK